MKNIFKKLLLMSFFIAASACLASGKKSAAYRSYEEVNAIYEHAVALYAQGKAPYEEVVALYDEANTLYDQEAAIDLQEEITLEAFDDKKARDKKELAPFFKKWFFPQLLLLDVIKTKLAHARSGKKNNFFEEYINVINQDYPGEGKNICALAARNTDGITSPSLLAKMNDARAILRDSIPSDLKMAIKNLNARSYDQFVSYLFGYFEGCIVFPLEGAIKEGQFNGVRDDMRLEMFALLDNVLFLIVGFTNAVKVFVDDQAVIVKIDRCVQMQTVALSWRLVRALDLVEILGYGTSTSSSTSRATASWGKQWQKDLYVEAPAAFVKQVCPQPHQLAPVQKIKKIFTCPSDGIGSLHDSITSDDVTTEPDFSDDSPIISLSSSVVSIGDKRALRFFRDVLPCAAERNRAAREIQLAWSCRPAAIAATWRDVGGNEEDAIMYPFSQLSFN